MALKCHFNYYTWEISVGFQKSNKLLKLSNLLLQLNKSQSYMEKKNRAQKNPELAPSIWTL